MLNLQLLFLLIKKMLLKLLQRLLTNGDSNVFLIMEENHKIKERMLLKDSKIVNNFNFRKI